MDCHRACWEKSAASEKSKLLRRMDYIDLLPRAGALHAAGDACWHVPAVVSHAGWHWSPQVRHPCWASLLLVSGEKQAPSA